MIVKNRFTERYLWGKNMGIDFILKSPIYYQFYTFYCFFSSVSIMSHEASASDNLEIASRCL